MLRIVSIVRAQIIPQNLDPATAGWKEFMQVVNNIITFVLVDLMPIVAIAIFAYAGFLYITAAGDEKKAKAATAWIKNAAIGLAIALSAAIAINTVIKYLGLEGQQDISPFEERVNDGSNSNQIRSGAQPI